MSDPIQDESEEESFNTAPETDVAAMLKKIQQQLAFLEKKIDTLLSQSSQGKPFEQKSFSRPFRGDRPSRPPFRDGRPSRPFRDDRGPRHSDRPRGFGGGPRSDDSGNRSFGGGGVRTFDNPHGAPRRSGGGGGFHSKGGGGKPFFRRKDRE